MKEALIEWGMLFAGFVCGIFTFYIFTIESYCKHGVSSDNICLDCKHSKCCPLGYAPGACNEGAYGASRFGNQGR